jgi:hypothetical protein
MKWSVKGGMPDAGMVQHATTEGYYAGVTQVWVVAPW